MLIEDFTIEGGLSREQMDIMHEKALYLIENVGIHIPHEGIVKRLLNYDGVKIDKDQVKFNSDLVMKALKDALMRKIIGSCQLVRIRRLSMIGTPAN
jgi:trimethylamine:corrinoid methyltransferase-like protein